jgi:thymidylate synthase ThyX
MRAHPLPEARRFADYMLVELRKVIPSFLTRIDRPERGGVWTEYLVDRREAMESAVRELWAAEAPAPGTSVTMTDFDPDGEDKVLAAMCYPFVNLGEDEVASRVSALGPEQRRSLFRAYVGDRSNRRHRPGRALERTEYRFDIVADYGAFRDLQRHRMLTVEWQPLGTDLGFDVPEIVASAGLSDRFLEALERSKSLHDALAPYFPEQSAYAVALAFNIRFVLQMNAREAMHVLELRSGPQGHPSYRRIVQEMHRLIAERAGHRAIADAMCFVDHSETELGRLEAESRAEARRSERPDQASDGGLLLSP